MIKIDFLTSKETKLSEIIEQEFTRTNSNDEIKIHSIETSSTKGLLGMTSGELIEISLTVSSNIFIGMLTNLIYDICKDRVKKIWINDSGVNINTDEIEAKIKDIVNNVVSEDQEE